MISDTQKLQFLKFMIIGRLGKNDFGETWMRSNEFPTEEQINQIVLNPIDNHRLEGLDWPKDAVTMIGLKRMDNLHKMLDYIRENNIEGDLIETGVWKGGATIFMKLYCDIYGLNKKVFVCDSFAGLPKPSGRFQQDNGDNHYMFKELAISLEEVQENFRKFKCLDDSVIFIKGFFKDTLPNNNQIEKLSLLRMDGDMYESTYDVFHSCYDKLSDKGICIIDDFCLKGARDCTHDFRQQRNITDQINVVDKCGIYWIKNELK